MGKLFHGVYDRREERTCGSAPARTRPAATMKSCGLDTEATKTLAPNSPRRGRAGPLEGASPEFDRAAFWPASRRRCSSARRSTTSVQVLMRWLTWLRAGRPHRHAAHRASEKKFSGVVFKIQPT
jgi:peptide subunit release factor RF-3